MSAGGRPQELFSSCTPVVRLSFLDGFVLNLLFFHQNRGVPKWPIFIALPCSYNILLHFDKLSSEELPTRDPAKYP